MSITTNEVIDLLTAAAAYDRRNVGQSDVQAWHKAGEIANWSYPEAEDALHMHFCESTQYLMPAHITARIRDKRRMPPPPDVPVIESAPVSEPAHFRTVIADLQKHMGWTPRVSPALRVRCPFCAAQPNYPCTRQTRHGATATAVHPSRVDLSEEQ